MVFLTATIYFSTIFLMQAGCKTPPPRVNKPAADLVDCNYLWTEQNQHVCIKNMPRRECEELFNTTVYHFRPDTECICDRSGKEKNPVAGTPYLQYFCR